MSLYDLKVGDYLENKGDRCKVIGVCGELVFIAALKNHYDDPGYKGFYINELHWKGYRKTGSEKFNLELGKFYVNKSGERVLCLKKTDHPLFPFVGYNYDNEDSDSYTSEGKFYEKRTSEYDIDRLDFNQSF